jgi:N6-adenosine-specific RNA methylase IME4
MSKVAPFPFRFGGFGTIVIDPPWKYEDVGGRMKLPYEPLTDEEILALNVDTLAPVGRDGHLYCWTDACHLELALECIPKWGYRYIRPIAWIKTLDDPAELRERLRIAVAGAQWKLVDKLIARIGKVKMGGGHYVRGAHELCLFATRGLTGLVHDIPDVIFAPHPRDASGKIIHSAKPPHIHRIAERLSPEPRIEIFARAARPGWQLFGNQAPQSEVA